MLVQEVRTRLDPAEVIRLSIEFFTTRLTPYGAFVQEAGDTHASFRVEAGEVVIGAGLDDDGETTLVRASTSRLHHEVSQFLAMLASPEAVRQNAVGPGTSGAG